MLNRLAAAAVFVSLAFGGPCLAAQPSSQLTYEAYADYLKRFNAGDDSYAGYYAENVVFDHGPFYGVLRGRQAIVDFYQNIRTQLQETVTVGEVSIDNARGVILAELFTRLVATKDGVALASRTLNRGDAYMSRGVVVYKLKDGKIVDIRGAISGGTFEPAK